MAFAEEAAPFLSDFGVEATVGGASVRGIFDDRARDVLGIAGSAPALTCASADIETVERGDAVVIGDASYTVANIEAYGTGFTRLILEAV